MAALIVRRLGSCRNLTFCKMRGYYRTYLSDAYRNDVAWDKCRQFESFRNVQTETYGMDLLEKYELERSICALDVEIFVNKIPELADGSKWLAEDLLYKFRHCQTNWPIRDSINHSIIKSYLKRGWTDKLVEMIRNRVSFGIFPDENATCILLDALLQRNDYKNAAYIAFEVMLQEDFDHPIRNALSLVAAVKHSYHNEGFFKPEPVVITDEEEIEYIPVKVVHNQFYDDHFDIVDEQFQTGKTIYCLAKAMPDLDQTLSNSLQLLGLGMYNKFKLANEKLEEWGGDLDSTVVDKYLEYLTEAPTRRDEIPNKPPSERVMEDEYELKRISEAEKLSYLESLEKHMENHQSKFTSLESIEKAVERYAEQIIKQNEREDIQVLHQKYEKWQRDRVTELETQTRNFEYQQKKVEIQEKLQKLQEKEELLSYFENKAEIILKAPFSVKKAVVEDVKEETEEMYVEAPGERNLKKTIKKGKK